MQKIILFFTLGILSLSLLAFTFDGTEDFYREVDAWHTKRINALKRKTGWLSLAGLYWLKPGKNRFGSAKDNDIIFPDDMPQYIGSFTLNDTIVSVSIKDNVHVLIDSSSVKQMELKNDNQEDTNILSLGHYSWYIIKREDKYGIRLKDEENPRLKNFTDIKRFPVDIKWRVKAHLEKYDPPKILKVPNVLGQVIDMQCPGKLVFKINGQTYSLDPVVEGDSNRYWLIFGDETNEVETYGGGRFLYIDAADESGNTYIDFNRAYNPPCVFSPYATCPLPPRQNKLKVRITAGEKQWDEEIH